MDLHLALGQMKQFGELGVKVYITEADVYLGNLTGTNEEKMQKQAQIYHDLFKTCLDSGVCHSITLFGFSDFRSMYNNSSRSDTKAKPLIFDEQFNPKLGFYGVLKAQLEAVFAN